MGAGTIAPPLRHGHSGASLAPSLERPRPLGARLRRAPVALGGPSGCSSARGRSRSRSGRRAFHQRICAAAAGVARSLRDRRGNRHPLDEPRGSDRAAPRRRRGPVLGRAAPVRSPLRRPRASRGAARGPGSGPLRDREGLRRLRRGRPARAGRATHPRPRRPRPGRAGSRHQPRPGRVLAPRGRAGSAGGRCGLASPPDRGPGGGRAVGCGRRPPGCRCASRSLSPRRAPSASSSIPGSPTGCCAGFRRPSGCWPCRRSRGCASSRAAHPGAAAPPLAAALLLAGFLLRTAPLNHPDFYNPDYRMHAGLVEVARKAGPDLVSLSLVVALHPPRRPRRRAIPCAERPRASGFAAWARRDVGLPYSILPHAVLSLLPLDYDGRLAALRMAGAFFAALPAALCVFLAARVGLSPWAAVLVAAAPAGTAELALGSVPAVVGHAADVGFILLLALVTPLGARRIAGLALALAAAQLVYVSATLLLPTFVLALALLVFFLEPDGRRTARGLLVVLAAGSTLALLSYYRDFVPGALGDDPGAGGAHGRGWRWPTPGVTWRSRPSEAGGSRPPSASARSGCSLLAGRRAAARTHRWILPAWAVAALALGLLQWRFPGRSGLPSPAALHRAPRGAGGGGRARGSGAGRAPLRRAGRGGRPPPRRSRVQAAVARPAGRAPRAHDHSLVLRPPAVRAIMNACPFLD